MNPSARTEISVVVPVYESASCIERLVERTRAALVQLQIPYEIILVDDGSRDPKVWGILERLAQADEHVQAIRLMRNFGKPAAVMCGLSYSKGEWVVTLDDDLQQKPEDIAQLFQHRSHDVVVATYARKRHRLDIRLFSAIKTKFDRHVLGLPFPMSPMKLISRKVVDGMLISRNRRPYIPALLVHVTTDFIAVPLEHRRSEVAGSRYNYVRRIRQFSNLLISNSGFLLRSTAAFGFIVICLGLLLGIVNLVRPPNFVAAGATGLLISLLVIVNGVVLMGLGFIGEYLIRIVDQGSARPTFVVRDEVLRGSDEQRNPSA